MIDPALSASSTLQWVSLQVATTGERYSHSTGFNWLRFAPPMDDKQLQTYFYLCPHLVWLWLRKCDAISDPISDPMRPKAVFPTLPAESGSRLSIAGRK